ncbi:hypothetical protein KPH14_011710 [Odynerus spinipes]|uniref:Secreted protein n=1 Tax=Odynerus spinipes TaxID=1348599 RepID=A0AAD9VUK2_9HYME|nr:hypothetical protein KPH14_011710 [Odynerus spinipes]
MIGLMSRMMAIVPVLANSSDGSGNVDDNSGGDVAGVGALGSDGGDGCAGEKDHGSRISRVSTKAASLNRVPTWRSVHTRRRGRKRRWCVGHRGLRRQAPAALD